MTLPSIPAASISLNQVNVELGLSGTATITMNDAAVRTLFGRAGSGTSISMSDGSGKSNATISLSGLTSLTATGFDSLAIVDYNVNSDGSISYALTAGGSGNFSPGWRQPNSTGIGSSYWVRVTQTASAGFTTVRGSARGTWHSLSTNKSFGIQTGNIGTFTRTYTFEISSDSGGATVLATATGIVMTCDVQSLGA